MSALATTDIPTEALELLESAEVRPDLPIPQHLRDKYATELSEGTMLPIVVIRPGLGRGKGRHLYSAEMLQENAHKFSGWKMYRNHLTAKQRKDLEGLPRPIEHVGGILQESWWDGSFPAEGRFGQGAVLGLSKPIKLIRDLYEVDPRTVETSISANATAVRPVNHDGARAWLVEGIEDKGSVDWVTEAGAGGRLLALNEAAYTEEEQMALIESMTDEEFLAYVSEQRPHLMEAVEAEEQEPEVDPNNKDGEAVEEDKVADITPQALAEALASDEFAETFKTAVDKAVQEALPKAVEEAVAEERDLIRAEAKAEAGREIDLRDMRDAAHKLIAESKLPEAFQQQVRSKFDLTESGPTAGLDVVDKLDDDGKVEKKAQAILTEAVQAEIKTQRDLLAAANPTRVKGQGPATTLTEGAEADKTEGTYYGSILQEAGIDPKTAWADAPVKADATA